MKILIAHNAYQVKGGEDSVFENEVALLRGNGHEVTELRVSNHIVKGFFSKFLVATSTVFSISGYMKMTKAISQVNPDVVHVHNYFPCLSPSIFYACKKRRVPVVHTLHNFRAICPTALLQYNGRVEERSVTEGPWWAVKKRVYRGSLVGTFLLSSMIAFHKRVGTWQKCVNAFIALTEFNRQKYIDAGWPEQKIWVKPNFTVYDADTDTGKCREREPYALFVGRLSEEKGIPFLLKSFKAAQRLNLKIIGDGPLAPLVQGAASANVQYLGPAHKAQVLQYMESAACLVMTSNWYEGFPMVIVEAMSRGLPVVVPALGNMKVVVPHGEAGLHYEAENIDSLIFAVQKLIGSVELRDGLSAGAKSEYYKNYTPELNITMLESIYDSVVSNKGCK